MALLKIFRVARNRIVAVKTNFLKSDAAILIKILPYRKLQIRSRQKYYVSTIDLLKLRHRFLTQS